MLTDRSPISQSSSLSLGFWKGRGVTKKTTCSYRQSKPPMLLYPSSGPVIKDSMTLHAPHHCPYNTHITSAGRPNPPLGHHPQRSGDITEEDPAITSGPWAPSGFFHRKVCLRAKPTPSCPLRVSSVKIKKPTRLLCVTLSAVAHFCNSNPRSLSFPLCEEGPLIDHLMSPQAHV